MDMRVDETWKRHAVFGRDRLVGGTILPTERSSPVGNAVILNGDDTDLDDAIALVHWHDVAALDQEARYD